MKILQSASKLVFLLMCVATIAGMFVGKITGEQFLVLSAMAFSYYFSKNGTTV